MNDKNEKDRDIFRKKFNDEFRRVRFYTNINGVRKEYGYDYNRDSEGKENYREIGEIPEEFGTEYIERILNLNRSFDWDSDLFTSSFERFAELIPSFEKIFSGKMNPQLTSGAKRETRILNQEAKNPHQVTYDLQVDKEKNQLYLIVELPGFIKEQVKLKLVKNHLELFAENSKKKIDTKIPIEQEIDKKQKIEATLRNGILEVKLKTVSEVNSDEKNISIN
ncbi:MAG: Hsp20/alpha crystallin family protein [Candidatus Heimdallarchaeota archaeon]|nr:Hsp20/alpha crystallin family protein [Candidatus Heimdallarchaeota archaeon]MCK4972976.1 Hsp20/alpha crystallin family protein [Candidatus Heimdallarchaeota archaeon]